jgi:hypothetical protein
MMSAISEAASLSRRYTNHSLQATTAHILDEARVPSRHVMSVTGHKSESSLKTYSGQTTKSTKRLMSETLSARSGVVSSNSKSTASSTITQAPLATNANFDIGFPLSKPCSRTLTTCNDEATLNDGLDEATLNDGLDNIYANIPMPNVPVLPTMYNCSNVTIQF